LTALNLFTTRFGQVLDLLDRKSSTLDYVLMDTPGQIEIFTWSASGTIITESIASTYPTVVVYVMDTPRCASPTTFMSNMLCMSFLVFFLLMRFVIFFKC
jgi:GTPase SAR1 family protein